MNSHEWLDDGVSRTIARQRAQGDSMKLLVTFVVSIAASLVGTVFQVRWTTGLHLPEKGSLALAASALVLAAIVFAMSDDVDEVDVRQVIAVSDTMREDDQARLQRLRREALITLRTNEKALASLRRVVIAQGVTSALAFGLAAVSLFSGS